MLFNDVEYSKHALYMLYVKTDWASDGCTFQQLRLQVFGALCSVKFLK